jgi:UDP-N-acetylenolpyruvoylglucosamine reductase
VSEDPIRQQLLKAIPEVTHNYTTGTTKPLGIGGVATYYTEVHGTVALVEAVKAACDANIPYRVIGQASSTIVGDNGFNGLLIKNLSDSYAISAEQSQLVVDSGMAMRRLITIAASAELGGLISLYAAGGSVGGSLFYNSASIFGKQQKLSDSLKSLTLLMPPSKMKPEPSIVRFKGTWLTSRLENGETKLASIAAKSEGRIPVVLTSQLQLTSLRSDEISRRLSLEVEEVAHTEPAASEASRYFGPIFIPPYGVTVEKVLEVLLAKKLELEGLHLSRRYPNYLTYKSQLFRKPQLPMSVARLEAFFKLISSEVETVFSTKLQRAYTILETPPEVLSETEAETADF